MHDKIKIDMNTGLYIESVSPLQSGADIIDTPCPDGFYRPRWSFETQQWVEGRTPEEIEAIKNQPQQKSQEERLEELAANVNDAMLAIMFLSIE